MQALVLVGGQGTRLRPLTNTVPKPALSLAGKPFLSYMLDWLREHGVDDVLLACGFEPDALRSAIGDGDAGQRITYLVEPEPRGTGGAVRFAEERLAERFLVVNGDVLTDLDLSALLAFHAETAAIATLGLYPVEDATGYGSVRRDEQGMVSEFLEKPDPAAAAAGGEINAGIYVIEHAALELIPPGREVSIEREVFPTLIGRGLRAMPLRGYWLDIGTPERFLQASWDILEGRVETAVGRRAAPGGLIIEQGAELAGDSRISPPALIRDGARVGAGAQIGPRAVLGRDCDVAGGATVERSIVGDGCLVGEDAAVRGAILAPGAQVAREAALGPGQVIGEGELAGTSS
ncbi:MAG: sugar phosphate nucleotidyltransferase [Solirubrobacterales bacterium]